MCARVRVHHTHPNKERLVSQSVASLRQVLDGNPVGAVAGWVVHAVLLRGTIQDHQAAILEVSLSAILDSLCKCDYFITLCLQLEDESHYLKWQENKAIHLKTSSFLLPHK